MNGVIRLMTACGEHGFGISSTFSEFGKTRPFVPKKMCLFRGLIGAKWYKNNTSIILLKCGQRRQHNEVAR